MWIQRLWWSPQVWSRLPTSVDQLRELELKYRRMEQRMSEERDMRILPD